jgi:hypothetical protein
MPDRRIRRIDDIYIHFVTKKQVFIESYLNAAVKSKLFLQIRENIKC